MVNKTVSLSEEMADKLKGEDNASRLIDRLLRNHYELITSPTEKLEEVKREIQKKEQEEETLQNKINEMQRKKEEIVNKQLEEETAKGDNEQTWERRRILLRETFENYIIDKDKIEELFLEFFNQYKEHKILNVVEFMQIRGYQRKVKKYG